MSKWKIYVISILIPLGVGLLASFLTRGDMKLYGELQQPALAPPAILFPIVWTILYVLMGIGSARISLADPKGNGTGFARTLYRIQLFLNFLWPIVFFKFQAFGGAFVLILLLLYTIIRMILEFYRLDRRAALLQIPYLLWVAFASYLNLATALLNR